MEERRDSEVMSGALDWTLNNPKYTDSALCDEIPGMSDDWDWVLKKKLRSVSDARGKSCQSACGFGPRAPRV